MRHLLQDLFFVLISVILAIVLVNVGALDWLLNLTSGVAFLGAFVAGMLFTSVFTTAPAVAALAVIMETNPLLPTALIGGLGAVVGDLIIFHFIKDRFSQDLLVFLSARGFKRKIKSVSKLSLLRWVSFLVGGLIIASPLPDELGITLLGFAKIRTSFFMLVSFVFNSIGIYVIGLVARAL